ncbi:putative NRPS-like protein biosynthetic cluster [Neofusicoccum ribis]|uniref:NRPS-like protein biosynthetic cluster n=1 Tax=Neofusicoccum ribis TaxID=45134 RepID=A0ABR3SDZ3_9PEZI
MDTNYFTCTLGQAARLSSGRRAVSNVNEFVDLQAQLVPEKPAVGFFAPPGDRRLPWGHRVLSFSAVRKGSLAVAGLMSRALGEQLAGKQTVALLCPSSLDFLLAWLALMRLGHAVLLIAPQCHPSAVSHLCRTCDVSILLYDETYQQHAQKSASESANWSRKPLQPFSLTSAVAKDICHTITEADSPPDSFSKHEVEHMSIAYLHHTSDSEKATFTTTPLYHGGIADLFRAWASDAPIWLFPAKELPITAANINSCLETAALCADKGEMPAVRYFSSVPYVLQMMEADSTGLHNLNSMEIVGVGGAALPAEVGDRLVDRGVNLVSRYGSAECGFLMSSHRNYARDKDWQYLRCSSGADFLQFEKQDDGTFELVIRPGWPHMAKTNRDDGSFATADLLVPHPAVPAAWKYHSRADSQLTLVTGKKFDPAPLEAVIAASPFLDDALIFGNGRPFPGALLFRTKEFESTADEELVDAVKPLIEKLNEESQGHARIPRNMLVPMAWGPEVLEKSSKGTVMRRKAEEQYEQVIERAYEQLSVGGGAEVADVEVSRFIADLIEGVVLKSKRLAEEDDLFAYGVDSVACMQIRYGLNQLLPQTSSELPLSVVEDCGTVKKLSEFIVKLRRGESYEDSEDEHQIMLDLAEKYSNFEESCSDTTVAVHGGVHGTDRLDVVVLTGATGALGAHILHLYRKSEKTSKIFCLARGSDEHAVRERVSKALTRRGLSGLNSASTGNEKVVVLQSQFGEANLGLSNETYNKIAAEATIIMHVAWPVNFRMRLRSFEDNIAAVFRVGQLSGDMRNGIWNTQEAWPMMLSTAQLTGCLPALQDEPLTWLPVDLAAEAFVQAMSAVGLEDTDRSHAQVYHVLNEHQQPDWLQLLQWLKEMEEFSVVDPREWLTRLEKAKDLDPGRDHPAMKLLGHWKNAYGSSDKQTGAAACERPIFDMKASKKMAPVLSTVKPVDEKYFRKIWKWLRDAKMG